MKRILLIHLGAYGDCVMATAIARQIKSDYPGCHLTWLIASRYAAVIKSNPFVDASWEFELATGESLVEKGWYRCKTEANSRLAAGDFDIIFNTQIYPDNVANFDGTTRSSTFRNYPHPITVPVTPVIQLLQEEIAHVAHFADTNRLLHYKHVILLECSPSSGQSFLTVEKGLNLAQRLVEAKLDSVVILSTHLPFESPHKRIISGACLSYRENAALSHYCTFLVGCSSGITWITTSDAGKRLNTVQFLSCVIGGGFASVAYDFAFWKFPTDHIIENTTTDPEMMFAVINQALDNFPLARNCYHQTLRPRFWGWLLFIDYRRGWRGILTFYRPLFCFIRRNGIRLDDVFDVASFAQVFCAFWKQFICRSPSSTEDIA